MKFILRKTNSPAEHYYFVAHGDPWPNRPDLRLIGTTTHDRKNARRFDAHEDALAALIRSGDPIGWEVDEVAE